MTAGPATQISPSSPGGSSSVPPSAQIATEVSGSGTPMLPGRDSARGIPMIPVTVSVSP